MDEPAFRATRSTADAVINAEPLMISLLAVVRIPRASAASGPRTSPVVARREECSTPKVLLPLVRSRRISHLDRSPDAEDGEPSEADTAIDVSELIRDSNAPTVATPSSCTGNMRPSRTLITNSAASALRGIPDPPLRLDSSVSFVTGDWSERSKANVSAPSVADGVTCTRLPDRNPDRSPRAVSNDNGRSSLPNAAFWRLMSISSFLDAAT